MVEKPSKLKPALLGGLVLGLGSVIPGLSYGNLCCCGWGLVGGALAANLLIKSSPVFRIKNADGSAAGALAGVVGSFIYLVIGVPLNLLQWNAVISQIEQRADTSSDPASRAAVQQLLTAMQDHPVLISLGIWLIFAIVGIGVAAIGGVIGVSMFEKRKGQQDPPDGGNPPTGYTTPGQQSQPGQAPYGGTQPPSY
jgi:MFS-type transporter involved in bile tolerance (Atg22 family)